MIGDIKGPEEKKDHISCVKAFRLYSEDMESHYWLLRKATTRADVHFQNITEAVTWKMNCRG